MSVGCRICGGASLRAFSTREMFVGTRAPFVYEECGGCGTLQIAEVPQDLAALYPGRYFDVAPRSAPPEMLAWLTTFTGLSSIQSVLDVGCATGAVPDRLASQGIRAVGVDPYAPLTAEQAQRRGWTFVRSLEEVTETFDVVIASDVVEHMPDVSAGLRALGARLAPGGCLVLAMPFADSPLAPRYGASWVGLDPGRHLHVLTRATFWSVARAQGLVVTNEENHTMWVHLALSEAWARGISAVDLAAQPIPPAVLAGWTRQAAALRRAVQGDAWAFALEAG